MAEFYFSPAEAAEIYFDRLLGSNEQVLLAEDMERGVCVYLYDAGMVPKITVFMNGELKEAIGVTPITDIEDHVCTVYSSWFRNLVCETPNFDDTDAPYDYDDPDVPPDDYDPELDGVVPEDELTDDDIIEESELHLEDTLIDFASEVIGCTKQEFKRDYKEKIPRLVDNIFEMMARKFDMPIYRPMRLQDDDGSYFISEYPYEEMVFDNDDNSMLDSKWERHSDGAHYCQNCGARAQLDYDEVMECTGFSALPEPDDYPGNYCHQCGARMIGVGAKASTGK